MLLCWEFGSCDMIRLADVICLFICFMRLKVLSHPFGPLYVYFIILPFTAPLVISILLYPPHVVTMSWCRYASVWSSPAAADAARLTGDSAGSTSASEDAVSPRTEWRSVHSGSGLRFFSRSQPDPSSEWGVSILLPDPSGDKAYALNYKGIKIIYSLTVSLETWGPPL